MKWERDGDYAISTPEGYRVSRAGPPWDLIYTAWAPDRTAIRYCRGEGGRKAARQACEKHWREQCETHS